MLKDKNNILYQIILFHIKKDDPNFCYSQHQYQSTETDYVKLVETDFKCNDGKRSFLYFKKCPLSRGDRFAI